MTVIRTFQTPLAMSFHVKETAWSGAKGRFLTSKYYTRIYELSFQKCSKAEKNHTWDGVCSRYGLEILLDRVYLEGKKREKLEPVFWYHCTIKDTIHATVGTPAIVRAKKCQWPQRINILILIRGKYLVNVHSNGTGYSIGMASTALKSTTEQRTFCVCVAVLSMWFLAWCSQVIPGFQPMPEVKRATSI